LFWTTLLVIWRLRAPALAKLAPPWVWTTGSVTPEAFTRFSMIVRVSARMSLVTG